MLTGHSFHLYSGTEKEFMRFFLPILLLAATSLLSCAPSSAVPAPTRGGTVVLALTQEPDTLNPYLASQRSAGEVHTFVIEGLVGVNEKGEYYPVLATEVPSKANGGVSEDGLTITYHLRQVSWSDGVPFTCADVQFTWRAVVDPKSGAVSTSGYRDIDSVACPDASTAVVHYRTFYAAFLVPFWAVLPQHAAGAPAEMTGWNYNREPLGTGPFRLKEWTSGDHITLVRNDNYRGRGNGKPGLDSIVVRFVPSRDVALQLLQSGQVNIVGDLVESDLPRLGKMSGVVTSQEPSPRSERLLLNLADPNIEIPDQALNHPHPILGDARVRQALELATNKEEIVKGLLYGQATIGTNELNVGWARCQTPSSEYNPVRARQLLDEAGWRLGKDGIRVSQGGLTARDGTRLRLKLQGPSGDTLREQVEQVLVNQWKEVGIEAFIENAPTAALFGTWESGSAARRGKFDILIYTTGPYVDPHSQIETYFSSWNIPLAANKGAGYNYSRWISATADDLIRRAGSTPDIAVRKNAYCTLMQEVGKARPQVYLYSRNLIAAYADNLQNWKLNVWKNLGWNSAEWVVR